MPRRSTIDSYLRIFQYKILNNILYLNKMLFKFGLKETSQCSFCKLKDETVIHLFVECSIVNNLWNKLRLYFSDCIDIPALMPQSAIFGYIDTERDTLLINHLLLIFKCYIYKSREKENLNLKILVKCIANVKYIEEKLCLFDTKKIEKFSKKWKKIDTKLKQS